MYDFNICISGVPIRISSFFLSSKLFFKDYYTEENALFSISITQADIEEEQERRGLSYRGDDGIVQYYSIEELEIVMLFRRIVTELLNYNILLFHSVAVAYEGKAYLFTAPSGTGKTTHAKLWLKNIQNSYILNGDKPFLLFKENKIFVCGSPWCGKEHYGQNEILPLGGLAVLNRAESNVLNRVSLSEVFSSILPQTYIPGSGEKVVRVINLLLKFNNVPLFRLFCNMNDEAALISFKNMVGEIV